jgi:hypothetical protein
MAPEATDQNNTMWVIDAATQKPASITFDQLAQDINEGTGRYNLPETVQMRRGDEALESSPQDLIANLQAGYRPESVSESGNRYYKDIYETVPGQFPFGTAAAGLLGVTKAALPGIGVGLASLGQARGAEDLAGLQAAHPTAVTIGEIGTHLATLGAGGLSGAGSKAMSSGLGLAAEETGNIAARLAARATSRVLGEGTFSKALGSLAGVGVRSGTEGAFFAAADALNDAALHDPDHIGEAMIAAMGPGALLGAGFGIGTKLVGGAVNKSFDAIKSVVAKDMANMTQDEMMRLAGKKLAITTGAGQGDLNKLSRKRGADYWKGFADVTTDPKMGVDGQAIFRRGEQIGPQEAYMRLDQAVAHHGKVIGDARNKAIRQFQQSGNTEQMFGKMFDDMSAVGGSISRRDETQRLFKEITDTLTAHSEGRMTGELFGELKDSIRDFSNKMGGIKGPSKSILDYTSKLEKVVDDAQEGLLKPALSASELAAFKQSNKAYATMVGVRNAVKSTMARVGDAVDSFDTRFSASRTYNKAFSFFQGNGIGSIINMANGAIFEPIMNKVVTPLSEKYLGTGYAAKAFDLLDNAAAAKAVAAGTASKVNQALSKSAWSVTESTASKVYQAGKQAAVRLSAQAANGVTKGSTKEEKVKSLREVSDHLASGGLPPAIEHAIAGLSDSNEGWALAQKLSGVVKQLQTVGQRQAVASFLDPIMADGKITSEEATKINRLAFAVSAPMETLHMAAYGTATRDMINVVRQTYPSLVEYYKASVQTAVQQRGEPLPPQVRRNLAILFDETADKGYVAKNQAVYGQPNEGQAKPGTNSSKPLSNGAADDMIAGASNKFASGSNPNKWSKP